jgi:hypothetical protein
MAKPALDDLYDIMRDPASGLRNRINAAIAASRVERLAMPGEAMPEAVLFLREIVGTEHEGSRFRVEYRRECATALSYYERRVAKMALTFSVADVDERRRQWRSLVNGAIRFHLAKIGKWPERKDILFTAADALEVPADAADPEVVLSGLLLGSSNRQQRRRQKAIDERATELWSGDESQRRELLRPIARLAAQRLQEFGLD